MIVLVLKSFYYQLPAIKKVHHRPRRLPSALCPAIQHQQHLSIKKKKDIIINEACLYIMCFVALLPFADVIASLLLFDCNNQPAMPASSSLSSSVSVVPSLLLPNSIVQSNTQRLLYRKQNDVINNVFTTSSTIASVPPSAEYTEQDVWNLPNGRVQFDRPLSFAGIKFQDGKLKSDSDSSTSSSISLWDPVFLGRYEF